jgi:tight adherence protein B
MNPAIIPSVLLALAVFSLFFALRRFTPQRDPLEERLREYGLTDYVRGKKKPPEQEAKRFAGLDRLLRGGGMGEKLAHLLMQADVPLSVGEFVVIMGLVAGGGFALGTWRVNMAIGLLVSLLFAVGPIVYLKFSAGRRRNAFINQLPDLLTLLVGSLRAGYGLSQAIELVAREVAAPANKEFARVVRATSLGLPLQRALDGMAKRMKSDDLDLVVTAINVQYEMGGNLSSVLETISDTIRERVRVLREVRVLTAQQRLTGMILAALPLLLGMCLALLRPGYFDPLMEPGWPRMLPLAAIGQMLIGFVLIQKIVNIKV